MGGDAAGGCDEEDWGNITCWFLNNNLKEIGYRFLYIW